MSQVFNSIFEHASRLLLALSSIDDSIAETELIDADFAATYGNFFGISQKNLHGTSHFIHSEYPQRKMILHEAIEAMVASGLVAPVDEDNHLHFRITQVGRSRCISEKLAYATEYQRTFRQARSAIRSGKLDVTSVHRRSK